MQIILASQSPRRQELLKRVVPAFTIAPADIDETVGKDGLPAEYVAQMAAQKAAAIAEQSPEALVIGCDTIVALAGEILGKPTSREDGYRMLRLLSGKTHDVYTSVTLKQGEKRTLRDSSFNRDVLSTDRHGNPCLLRYRRICRQSRRLWYPRTRSITN